MFFLSLLVILSGYNYLHSYISIKSRKSDQKGIAIFSYNVKDFAGPNNKTDRRWGKTIIQNFLQDKNPDIICLQEIDSFSIKGFNPFQVSPTFPDSTFYSTIVSKNGNLTIVSRYPIVEKGDIYFKDTPNMIIFADIKVKEDTFRIYNCHLQSYQFPATSINALNSISLEDQNQNLKNARFLGYRIKRTFIERAKQVRRLKEHIFHSPYPVIVCGDFNDTPVSYTYHTLQENLKDAFVESGIGTGNTFKGRLFSFRIDYILHSNELDGYNFQVGKVKYSDHNPISCTLVRK